jgi:hypothetical protein
MGIHHASGERMNGLVDPDTMRRLLVHEARVHAMPNRELRDLGDAILLYDPAEPEPFWNRVEAIRWPADANAFDRRLTEVLVLFTSIGRQPTSGCRRRRPGDPSSAWSRTLCGCGAAA